MQRCKVYVSVPVTNTHVIPVLLRFQPSSTAHAAAQAAELAANAAREAAAKQEAIAVAKAVKEALETGIPHHNI